MMIKATACTMHHHCELFAKVDHVRIKRISRTRTSTHLLAGEIRVGNYETEQRKLIYTCIPFRK